MGLDTTHDCWHGSYGSFMHWRSELNAIIAREKFEAGDLEWGKVRNGGTTTDALELAWDLRLYDNSEPISILMNHSDCDGLIAPEDCTPLADALQHLVDAFMPERSLYDRVRPATERFIAGLRLAAARREPVEFA